MILLKLGLLALVLTVLIVPGEAPWYLFTSFRGNGEDGLHLAISRDGRTWKAVGDDRSWLKPAVGNGKLMRDPSLARGPDGVFRLVWTTGWWDQTIGYASSTNLVDWGTQKAIPVMAHEPAARNAWAPEIFYDDVNREWLILWASTIPGKFPGGSGQGANEKNHRIYAVTTKDFEKLSATKLFFDPGFNVIDATIIRHGGKYYLIFKDEREEPVKKNLRIAVASRAQGPYEQVSEAFTRDWVEGPSALKIGGEWFVYFDIYREKRYGAVKSKDLKNWVDVSSEMHFPSDHRHGTVIELSEAIARGLN